jgi:NADH dehydrogenase
MRVAIVGGTGFVGGYLVDSLLSREHNLSLLVRPGSEDRVRRREECRIVTGDLDDADRLDELLDGADAAIYNVGILREEPRKGITFERMQFEGASRVVDAAAASGAGRLLLMSANGVRADGTAYQATKHRAEQAAFASSLAVTVFRPSVIFGDPRGKMEFATQLLRDMVRPPVPAVDFFSAFGPHKGPVRMSPVHVEDVAEAFARALDDDSTIGQTYELGGPDVITWGDMVRMVAEACGRTKWLLPVPIEIMSLAAALLDWLPVFPVTRDQLRMLAEGNIADPDVLAGLIGRAPRSFSARELAYLQNG